MEIAELAAIVTGYTLFSAAYLAENVRGGLQSVMRGQYEAADAIGLTTSQRTGFIVIPQALRVSIPPLVGQAIGVFKETSLVLSWELLISSVSLHTSFQHRQNFLESKEKVYS
ncbi:MAG: hypothetical protein CM15mP49_32080 [Actinomycetota bacterium]|nr:MAG: hypothetical protein CM15mP49_32080 [Actinomycetota bacterium]